MVGRSKFNYISINRKCDWIRLCKKDKSCQTGHEKKARDFPGGPEPKTLHSQCRGPRN